MIFKDASKQIATHSKPRLIPTRRKFLFACVAVLSVLALLEGFARVLSEPGTSGRFHQISEMVQFLSEEDSGQILAADPESFWRLQPGVIIDEPRSILFQGLVSNSRGYRNEEFSLKRDEGTQRVVCFGDSSTFGIGTPHQETWPSQLQELLNAVSDFEPVDPPRTQIINAGVPGYTSYQILQKMRRELVGLEPDAVFVTCANNDFWRWDNRTDEEQAVRLRDSTVRKLLMMSRACQVADSWFREWRGASQDQWAAKATLNYFHPQKEWTPRVPLDDFEKNLLAMADLCESKQVPLIFVLWPDQPQAAGKWSIRIPYQDVMQKVAADRGVYVADIATAFRRRPWSVRTYIPNDIVHVNAEGNRIAAETAQEVLVELLNPARSSDASIIPVGFVAPQQDRQLGVKRTRLRSTR